jgi:hypothetical protein
MPKISNVILRPIQGHVEPGFSVLSFDYTVTFDANDQALGTPYDVNAHIIGDDTNVAGDAPGGSDDPLSGHHLGVVTPNPPVQVLGKKLKVHNHVLNEDSANGDTNPNPDEILVRIQMTPLKAPDEVWSPDSNTEKLTLV